MHDTVLAEIDANREEVMYVYQPIASGTATVIGALSVVNVIAVIAILRAVTLHVPSRADAERKGS